MTDSWNEFEDDWEFLKAGKLVLVSNQASDFKSQIEIARAKTAFDLTSFSQELLGKELTPEILSQLVSKYVATFLANWRIGLREQSILGLIEVILENQDLTPEELRKFLGALPLSLLEKLLEAANNNQLVNGVHGILAVEMHCRNGLVSDYTIGRESGRFYIEFVDVQTRGTVRVFTDDFFKV
jgi:hypothetical protein